MRFTLLSKCNECPRFISVPWSKADDQPGLKVTRNFKHSFRQSFKQNSNPSLRGFTLIEVMVVLVIMSIMALLSWQGIQTMLKTREQSLGLVSGVDSIQTAVSQWRVDLDNTLSVPASANVPSLDWDARVLRLVRRSSSTNLNSSINPNLRGDAPLGPGANVGPGSSESSATPAVWVVAWSVRALNANELSTLPPKEQRAGLYWLRWQSPPITNQTELNAYWQMAAQWGQNPSAESRAFETALFEIQNWQLYFYRNNAWTNALSSAGDNTLATTPSSNTVTSGTATNSASNGSSLSTTNNTGSANSGAAGGVTASAQNVFPDGVRLKLYLPQDKVLGTGSQDLLVSNPQNDPSLTMDWVRLNFTAAKL